MSAVSIDTEHLLVVTFVIGITAEAITAALSAGRLKMDWFGITSLAAITALGGGTLRDLVLDNHPLTWVERPWYLVIVVTAALITAQLAFLMAHFEKVFLVADAVGLATFSVLGTQIALELGHGFVVAVVAATVTGVSGGVMRDILSDRVPLVFSQEIYAAVSVLTTIVYMLLDWAGLDKSWVIIISLVTAFGVRLIAIKSHKHFPQFHYQGKETPIDPRLQLPFSYLRRGASSMRRRAGQLRSEATKYSLLNWRRAPKSKQKPQAWPPEDESGKKNDGPSGA